MNHQPAVGDGRVRGWLSLISHSQADFSLPGCLSGGGGVVGVLAVSGYDAKLGVLPLQTRARPMSCATASLTLTPTHRSRHTCVHKHRQACTHSHACTCARARAHARARTHTRISVWPSSSPRSWTLTVSWPQSCRDSIPVLFFPPRPTRASLGPAFLEGKAARLPGDRRAGKRQGQGSLGRGSVLLKMPVSLGGGSHDNLTTSVQKSHLEEFSVPDTPIHQGWLPPQS